MKFKIVDDKGQEYPIYNISFLCDPIAATIEIHPTKTIRLDGKKFKLMYDYGAKKPYFIKLDGRKTFGEISYEEPNVN